MKYPVFFLFLLTLSTNAQWTDNGNNITTTDNVGIGTTSPDAQLHVHGSNAGSGNVLSSIMIGKHNGPEIQAVQESADDDKQGLAFRVKSSATFADSNYEALRINMNGNVGIGTTNPDATLHIDDLGNSGVYSLKLNNRIRFRGDGVMEWGSSSNYGILSWDINKAIIGAKTGSDLSLHASGGEKMRILANGNVGIGINSPDAKLAVNGNIHTKEVKVDLVGWPDYVFEKSYNLPTLEQVENHIKEKGHLKDIPSAKEVEKDGILLGEMDSKLLQKIEELVIYTIQQQKEIKELKSRLGKLESKY